MEDVNTLQEAPPEEEVAENLQEGFSDSSDDEEAASFADDSPESTIEPGVVKAVRRLAKYRTSFIPLAVLASALVLALAVRRQTHPVEVSRRSNGCISFAGGRPAACFGSALFMWLLLFLILKNPVLGALEWLEEGLLPVLTSLMCDRSSKEELVEAAAKPKVEPIGLPGLGGVLEETPEKPLEPTPPEKLPGVSQEELVEGGEKPKVEPIGLPGVSGVPEETPKKPVPVKTPAPVRHQRRFYEYENFEARKLLRDVVRWAKEAPVDKDKSQDGDELWEYRLVVVWRINGVRYNFLGRFMTLTPAYDAVKAATELEKSIPELLEKTRLYEKEAREGKDVPACILDFGDPGSGKGRLSINSEFFRSIRLAIAPPSTFGGLQRQAA
ncbi:hypothetical protein Emed_003065 [Eimeria media]